MLSLVEEEEGRGGEGEGGGQNERERRKERARNFYMLVHCPEDTMVRAEPSKH